MAILDLTITNEYIRAVETSRTDFVEHETPPDKLVRTEIVDSWKRSRQFGIDSTALTLPQPVTPDNIQGNIKKFDWVLTFFKDQMQKLYKLTEMTKSVVFFTDENQTVIMHKGDKALLKKLNAINLGVGSRLNEDVIGTNAVALSALNKTEALVYGPEHYLEGMQDFVCSCIPIKSITNSPKDIYYLMFVTLRKNFTPFKLAMLSYFATTINSNIDLYTSNLNTLMTGELISLGVEQHNRGIMFVNNHGVLIHINQWIAKSFGISSEEICGSYFDNIFPELKDALDCMKTGKTIHFQEIILERLPSNRQSLFMECQPIIKAGESVGMIVSLYDSQHLNRIINRPSGFKAQYTFSDLLGTNANFLAAKTLAETAARSSSNILITGESGTGKELFAQAIHNASKRARGPFISINCAAIPRDLIGSELFGYHEGAFTGARKGGAPGKFELANNGTIFLDEIGEMPMDMQAVLLRVLEERVVTRLGGGQPTDVNVRLITATNSDLWEAVKNNKFRLDLYYRLNVIKIELAPLRERSDDLQLLISHFLKQYSRELQKNVSAVSPEVLVLLRKHDWLGNIRELRNVIERGVHLCATQTLTIVDLPREIASIGKPETNSQNLKSHELRLIQDLLAKHNGNKSLVAAELGISRATLYRKIKEQ